MNVVTRSEILAAMEAQHTAIDTLMAALLNREGALQRNGLIERKDMFVPSKSGPIWDAVKLSHASILNLKAAQKLVVD